MLPESQVTRVGSQMASEVHGRAQRLDAGQSAGEVAEQHQNGKEEEEGEK